jgi:hypothetical protein
MDPEVARLIVRHRAVVAEHRRQLGIPAVRRRRAWTRAEDRLLFKRWTSKENNLLGTMPDAELAERLGRSAGEVRKRRCSLGIPFPGAVFPHREWTRDEEALLGTDTDAAVARKLKRGTKSIRHRRELLAVPAFGRHDWTEAEQRLLGTDIDRVIAQKLGRTAVSVSHMRRLLGLPPAIPPGAAPRGTKVQAA